MYVNKIKREVFFKILMKFLKFIYTVCNRKEDVIDVLLGVATRAGWEIHDTLSMLLSYND